MWRIEGFKSVEYSVACHSSRAYHLPCKVIGVVSRTVEVLFLMAIACQEALVRARIL